MDTYFLIDKDGIISQSSNIQFDKKGLGNGEKVKKANVDFPELFIGKNKDIFSRKESDIVAESVSEKKLDNKKTRLRKLWGEIQFLKDIGDDTSTIEKEYEELKLKYQSENQ